MTEAENPPFQDGAITPATADDPLGVALAKARGITLGEVGTMIMLDNNYVRVWDAVLAPGETQPWHVHRWPHLIVAMSDDEAEAETVFGARRRGKRMPGRTVLLGEPEPVHKLTNISAAQNVTRLIEVKTLSWDETGRKQRHDIAAPPGRPIDAGLALARRRGITLGEVGHGILMDNDLVRVWEILLEPGETLPMHHHKHPYVAVTIEGATTEIETVFGESFVVQSPPGHVVSIDRPEPAHQLTNNSDVTYRSRLIEVKGASFPASAAPPS